MAGSKHVKIQGIQELSRKLKALPEVVERAAKQAVQDETIAVAQDMRRNAPRETGNLADKIQAEIDSTKLTGKAVSTAPYTTFVVHGTSKTAANDFMTPAALRSGRRFPRRVREQVRTELKKLAK
jgi:HK97 gp10 family phage protein